jgi:hypothetical protein
MNQLFHLKTILVANDEGIPHPQNVELAACYILDQKYECNFCYLACPNIS